MFANIILLSPPYAELTYKIPPFFSGDFWKTGLRVAVPLGGKNRVSLRAGYVKKIETECSLPPGVQCRDLSWPLETSPILDAQLVRLASDLALRHGVEEGRIFGQALPAGLRSTAVKIKCIVDGAPCVYRLSELFKLSESARVQLAAGLLDGSVYMPPPVEDELSRELCILAVDPPWPVRPSAKKQIEILDFLHETGVVNRRFLTQRLGTTAARPFQALLRAGLVKVEIDQEENSSAALLPPPPEPFELNAAQKEAVADLEFALAAKEPLCRLLYGVTGSGKTAVYLRLAEKCLAAGQSAMLLAPEIALAYKLYRDVREGLPHYAAILYHGGQTPRKREHAFRGAAERCEPFIVVGTRSALFLPIKNIGCIILDEEHDSSFKQDDKFAYHAKEVAWFRIGQTGGLLVLGSATPDIKTFHAASSGKISILRLGARVGERPMPPVELVDIGALPGRAAAGSLAANVEGQGLLGHPCEDALRECLRKGDQAVVLLNRRGYSPMIYCLNCARTLRCPHCEIGLAYHKNVDKLICHYCGYSAPYPAPCPDCGRINYLPIGEGTEKLAEKLETIAGKPILRLDRDSARRPGRMEEILKAFSRRESPFLVGTQMLSKGHHFPGVTLVVVADGDIGLNLPDYRASERTFQLLVQAAGRAGRGEKPGHVLIQTRDTAHYCWKYITRYDYEGFYAEELERRKKRLYPPFTNLALLRISFGLDDVDGDKMVRELGLALRAKTKELGLVLLGPAPAPISLLRGRKRFQCLIKGNDWRMIRQLSYFAAHLKCARNLRLFLDLDPVNML